MYMPTVGCNKRLNDRDYVKKCTFYHNQLIYSSSIGKKGFIALLIRKEKGVYNKTLCMLHVSVCCNHGTLLSNIGIP